jgi:hypothetical protein
MAGELTTTHYGWTKPTVGASTDAWGGYINSDLDGIDATVYSIQTSVPAASSTTPVMDGTAAVGVGTTWARADHVHPSDTSRYAASNPSGYQTAAQVTASLGAYLPLAGGTMTGAITLAADPAAPLQASTKQYVDAKPAAMNDNRIINGDMRIDQRNNGATGTAINAYTVDRWQYVSNQAGKGTWGRNLNAAVGPVGFPVCLGFQSSSAYASLAGDSFFIHQPIEADMISDFAWGSASAQSVTLSFWANSSLTGTFGGAVRNYAATRSYPFTYSIPTANTWTKIVITIPGDTAGTWVMSGNAGSLVLSFDLGGGSNFRGPAGAWASANYPGATGSVSIVATNAASFYVTGVKLEIGSVATPFNRQSLAKSMADCQRYYSTINPVIIQGYNAAAGVNYETYGYPVAMRALPTIAILSPAYTNGSGLATNGIQLNGLNLTASVTALGNSWASCTLTLNAEL